MEKFREVLVLDDQEMILEEYEGEKGYLKISFSNLRDQDVFSDTLIYTPDLEDFGLALFRYLKHIGDTESIKVYTGIYNEEFICNDIFIKDKILEMRTLRIGPKGLYVMIDADINPYYIVLSAEKIKAIIGLIVGGFYQNNQIYQKFHMFSDEEKDYLIKEMAVIKSLYSVIIDYNQTNVDNEIKKKNIEKLKELQEQLRGRVRKKITIYLEHASSK